MLIKSGGCGRRGGFFSACGSDESFGFDARPGGRTALYGGKWIFGGRRQEEVRFYSWLERCERTDHTRVPVRKSQTATSA